MGRPPPIIRAMPERKRFFSIDPFPKYTVENLAVHEDVQSWPEQAETHRLRPKAQQRAVLEVV